MVAEVNEPDAVKVEVMMGSYRLSYDLARHIYGFFRSGNRQRKGRRFTDQELVVGLQKETARELVEASK